MHWRSSAGAHDRPLYGSRNALHYCKHEPCYSYALGSAQAYSNTRTEFTLPDRLYTENESDYVLHYEGRGANTRKLNLSIK